VVTRYDWWSFVGTTAVTGSKRLQLRKRAGTREAQQSGRRRTPDEVSPQLALSQVVSSNVAVNGARHYVRWANVEGLDGVLSFFQGLNGLTALGP